MIATLRFVALWVLYQHTRGEECDLCASVSTLGADIEYGFSERHSNVTAHFISIRGDLQESFSSLTTKIENSFIDVIDKIDELKEGIDDLELTVVLKPAGESVTPEPTTAEPSPNPTTAEPSAPPTIFTPWLPALTLGPGNAYNGEVFDIGESEFNRIFREGDYQIIKRECSSCVATHQEIYYRRFTNIDTFDVYGSMFQWDQTDNQLPTDIGLYSTLEDAINAQNVWAACDYGDYGVGAFRNCGPTGIVGCNFACDTENLSNPWRSHHCCKASKFSIYMASDSGSSAHENAQDKVIGDAPTDNGIYDGEKDTLLNVNIKISSKDLYIVGSGIIGYHILFILMASILMYKCYNGAAKESYEYKSVKFQDSEFESEAADIQNQE